MVLKSRIPDPAAFEVMEMPSVLRSLTSVLQPPPDVTVVTVVFNAVKDGRQKRFRQCLDSVQMQTGCLVEHLIVDGASTDGTLELVRAESGDRRVDVRVISKKDSGIYEAMNRGIALARGKYVVFLNSDDRFIAPEGLSASFAALESAGADFSYAPVAYVDNFGQPLDHSFATVDEGKNLFSGMTICHQTILMRREVLLAVDGFDYSYRSAADYDLLLRVIYAGYRGVRVMKRFVEFQRGGFSARHRDLSENEVDLIFQRLLRENLKVDISRPALRCMRRNGEWPPGLAEKIRQIGEHSFRCSLPPVIPEHSQWMKCTNWRFETDLAAFLWKHGHLFWLRHPMHALGAIKAWIVHRTDDPLPLRKWLEIRCTLMVERLKQRNRLVYPSDCVVDEAGERRSMRGLICTNLLRTEHSFVGLSRRERIMILLSSSSLQDCVRTVEVRICDKIVGHIALEPYALACWGDFPVPEEVAMADGGERRSEVTVAPIELKMVGGGRFVFDGLCLVPH